MRATFSKISENLKASFVSLPLSKFSKATVGFTSNGFPSGKEGQQNTGLADDQNSAFADSQLTMMERLGVLFTRYVTFFFLIIDYFNSISFFYVSLSFRKSTRRICFNFLSGQFKKVVPSKQIDLFLS